MNLANKLTIFRMILVPILVIVPFLPLSGKLFEIPIQYIIMTIIFIIAYATDKLDGYIARSRNQITTFGKFLDPIADKILVLAAMLIAWIPIIVIIREFLVSGYRLVAVEKQGKVIAANMWGKLKTVTQMLAIILAMLDLNGFGDCISSNLTGFQFVYNVISTILMSISVIATIFSGIDYLKNGKDLFKE